MKVYVFKGKSQIFGFTPDQSGSNLPSEHQPWKKFKELDIVRGETPRIAVNTDEVLDSIAKRGYHIQGATITFSEGV